MLPESKFNFTIGFENLSKEELGLLLFAIDFDEKPDGDRCHHLGMGKPLGMGTVKVRIELVKLFDRKARYESLLSTGEYDETKITNKIPNE